MTLVVRSFAGLLSCALVTFALGCGRSASPTDPGPLKEPDKISPLLPKGVTLETPVNPDKLYGESSKTVQEALASLQVYVKDGVIYDGIGHEVHFDTETPAKAKSRSARGKSQKAPRTVISIKQ